MTDTTTIDYETLSNALTMAEQAAMTALAAENAADPDDPDGTDYMAAAAIVLARRLGHDLAREDIDGMTLDDFARLAAAAKAHAAPRTEALAKLLADIDATAGSQGKDN